MAGCSSSSLSERAGSNNGVRFPLSDEAGRLLARRKGNFLELHSSPRIREN